MQWRRGRRGWMRRCWMASLPLAMAARLEQLLRRSRRARLFALADFKRVLFWGVNVFYLIYALPYAQMRSYAFM